MSLEKNIALRKKRRKFRSKKALKRGHLPRVSVFRSLKHMYAQVVDDKEQKTLASSSTLSLKDLKGDKIAQAHAVAKNLASQLQEKGVEQVAFDRGAFLYHGRVKAIAEGLRESGIKV